MSAGKPSVLVVASKWWPLSARLAIALLRHGCSVSTLCAAGHPLTYVTGIQQRRHYRGISSLASLYRTVRDVHPDVVIPCDDGVVAQLHELHRDKESIRGLVEQSLGSPDGFPIVSSRYNLTSAATELGIRAPETRKVTSTEDLLTWHKELGPTGVLKIDGESGGNGVRICHSLEESLAAWREFNVQSGALTAWKRFAIDRNPLALWAHQKKFRPEVTIQEFITGHPANSMFVCHQGKLLSLVSVTVVASEGPTGAATVVRRINNECMTQAAERLAARLGLSGFYGLDFVMAADTDIPHLIELNPRCTQLGHLEFPDQGSLAGVFSAAWRGEPGPIKVVRPIDAETIALFPQARAAGGICNQLIDASYHDVPSEEPRLVSELLLGPWPQRRWAARIYHAVKPLARTQPVAFENLNAVAVGDENSVRTAPTVAPVI